MTPSSVLLDTSFFLRFLNDQDPLFRNADGYFRYFLQKEYSMMISTISIAEYCVRGEVLELPLRNLQVVPFNLILITQRGLGSLQELHFRRETRPKSKNEQSYPTTQNSLPKLTLRIPSVIIYHQTPRVQRFFGLYKRQWQ